MQLVIWLLVTSAFMVEGRRRTRDEVHVGMERPYFRNSQSVQQAQVGDSVKFDCDVANLGKNVITWSNLTSNRIIFAGKVNVIQDDRLSVFDAGRELRISNVGEFDSGKFRCTVEMMVEPISLEHHLNVLVPPRVYPSPPDGNYAVRSGSDVNLICHAEGSPRPTITWTKKDKSSLPLPSGELSVVSPILTIPAVERFDAGEYECTADNGVGTPATAILNLQVIYAPIVDIPEPKVFASPGQEEVTLECVVHGEPRPSIEWRHQTNNQKPSSDPKDRLYATMVSKSKSVLKIRYVDDEDFGVYECAGFNNEGHAAGEIELTGEPQKPTILSPRDSDKKRSYTLRWSVKSPYKILQQKVNYWEVKPASPNAYSNINARDEPRNELRLDSHEQARLTTANLVNDVNSNDLYVYEVNIPDLSPDRLYAVQVRATNKFKEGEWSDKFYFETSGRVQPLSVQGGLISSGSHVSASVSGIVTSIFILRLFGAKFHV